MISKPNPNWGKPGKYLISKRVLVRSRSKPWKVWGPTDYRPIFESSTFDAARAFVSDQLKGQQ